MSELRDLRAKITVEADAALDAVSRVTGMERSEIVRGVLHRWALQQRMIGKLLDSRWKAEGLTGALEGVTPQDLRADTLEVTGIHKTLKKPSSEGNGE